MNVNDLFMAELHRYEIQLCLDCKTSGGSGGDHYRGFASDDLFAGLRTVHLSREIKDAGTLHRGFHEIGHISLGHLWGKRQPSWQLESEAEVWAVARLGELGISPDPAQIALGERYIADRKANGWPGLRSGNDATARLSASLKALTSRDDGLRLMKRMIAQMGPTEAERQWALAAEHGQLAVERRWLESQLQGACMS